MCVSPGPCVAMEIEDDGVGGAQCGVEPVASFPLSFSPHLSRNCVPEAPTQLLMLLICDRFTSLLLNIYVCVVCVRFLPDSDLQSGFRLQVEVVCVVQSLVQRSLQVDEVRHPHCGGSEVTDRSHDC